MTSQAQFALTVLAFTVMFGALVIQVVLLLMVLETVRRFRLPVTRYAPRGAYPGPEGREALGEMLGSGGRVWTPDDLVDNPTPEDAAAVHGDDEPPAIG